MLKRKVENPDGARLAPVDSVSVAAALESALAKCPFPRLHHADVFLLVRGYPVVSWIPFKPAEVVWRTWLRRLSVLHMLWSKDVSSGASFPGWQEWSRTHVSLINARTAEDGLEQALASLRKVDASVEARIHVVGHSVGAHAAIRLLDTYGHRPVDVQGTLGSVVALDAALNATAWMRSALEPDRRTAPRAEFAGLGAWAASHGVGFIQVTNTSDWWTYGKMADGPYLPVKSQNTVGILDQLNGAGHDQIRQWVELTEVLWR